MKFIFTLVFLITSCSACIAQKQDSYLYRQLLTKFNVKYHYIQGNFIWSPTNVLYGLQYKRQFTTTEAGIFSFCYGSALGVNFTNINDKDFLNTNLEVHASSYPFTALIRIGLGVDYLSDFNTASYFSFYPSIGFDIGIVELSYSYLINSVSPTDFSDHRIKISIGPWITKNENM